MFEVEKLRYVLLSKLNLCAFLRKKLEVFNTKAKEVYGDAHKVCMVMKIRENLFLEAQIELENNVVKVIVEEEKTYNLKVRWTSSYRIG
jgi:hypothetical protein